MKIKICSPQLGIAPESNSGGEVYDREVIKAFCNQGVKVITILPSNKPYVPHKNLKVYYLPLPFVWPPYLFNLLIIPYLFWLYKKEKFNILRIHSPYFVGLGGLIFKLFFPKIPLVATYHHLEDNKPFYNLINKLFINRWDKINADSRFTKKEIIKKYKVEEEEIKVVYAGVGKKFKPLKKKAELINKYGLKDKKILLFLGELKPRKNVSFLLKVLKELDYPKVRLLICGRGRLYRKLIKQAEKLKIKDKIIFTGFIPEREKVDYYNLADIFLFPSKKEGFGMPVIEAGACGVPSIVSDVSSLKELVLNGKTGYLAKTNDFNDWKDKVERLFKNDNLRKKIGRAAHRFNQNFSWDKTAAKLLKIYYKLL